MSLKGVDIEGEIRTTIKDREKQKKKKEKKELYFNGYPIKEYTPILFFFSIIAAISIIGNAIGEPTILEGGAILYLMITFFLYYNSTTSDKEYADRKIAELKQEIRRLESNIEGNELIIELLEKDIERLQDNSPQELH